MDISFIVPVVNIENGLRNLIYSISKFIDNKSNYEIILINQSNYSICSEFNNLQINEFMAKTLMPAAEARNLGAALAQGKYLFFLDDDAILHDFDISINKLLEKINECDAWFCNRGHIESEEYISHWPKNAGLSIYNFSSFGIEWNLIIKKHVFISAGGFDPIGTGSNHSALSGELFILVSKLMKNHKFRLLPELKIAHPKLLKAINKREILFGYYYGNGYSIGKSICNFNLNAKIYWFFRFSLALSYDFIYRNKFYKSTMPVDEYSNSKLCVAKLQGFIDGLNNKIPKGREWILNL